MNRLTHKIHTKQLRKHRVRATVSGTTERPRLSITVSNIHVSGQVIDDSRGVTLVAATSVGMKQTGTMTEKAAFVGADLAKKAKKAKITKLVVDRNGRRYAGRLKALVEEIRKEGIEV